ncbi:hypothetical protein [Sulfurimonas sp. CS5]|uniref:hypothetical protein n=1 Tax=Sulfurimonas sp. CS5 TaxID=3391145 RepID=UPI0039ED46BF
MRNNLGRVILILIFLNLNLIASTYKWSATANKSTAMTNEAIYLKYVCEYSDATGLYVIEFNPVVDNDEYSVEILSETEKIQDGKKINTFEFVAFVKHAGVHKFVFETTMKKTNKDSIQNTVLGRDNSDYEEFSQKVIKQEVISVDVKESSNELVGEFILKVKKDEQKLKAYEPYHLEIKIEGVGDFRAIKPITFNIDGVKIFSQKTIENITLTKDGYKGSWSQKFAFVGEKDFKIPKVSIEYFDLKEQKIKEMTIDAVNVEVEKAYKKEELLDAEEKGFEFNYTFLYYILTFIAGYLFAKLNFKREKNKDAKEASFKEKIQNSKSLKKLMIVLALKDSKKYEGLILKIEKKEITSLAVIKKKLLN